MAQKSVDRIADAFVRHQIRLIRVAVGMGRGLVDRLRAIDPQLRALLETRVDRLAKDRVTFGKTTKAALVALAKAIRTLQDPTWKAIEKSLRADLLTLAKSEVGFAATTVEAALPVTVAFNAVPAKTINQLTFNEPIEGRTLNQWTKGLRRADQAFFISQVQEGLAFGETSEQIAKRMFGTVRLKGTDGVREVTRRSLRTITNTSVNSVTNQARSAFYLKNKDTFSKEVFVATLDARTTAVCRANDGEVFDINEGPIPPLHPNCRSLRIPELNDGTLAKRPATGATDKLLEGLKGDERRAAVRDLTGQVPAKTTYAQFIKRQPVAFQNEVLGVTKGKLFRNGGLSLDKFINPAGKELSIAQLRISQPQAFTRAGL